MSRFCMMSRLASLIDTHPTARSLPPAAQAVWLRVGRLAAAVGTPAELRVGELEGGESAVEWLARILSFRVSDLAPALEVLERCGALLRRPEGWRFPAWCGGVDPRAEASRENGKKGGRPRKSTAQRELLLPLAGGAVAGSRQAEEPAAAVRDAAPKPAARRGSRVSEGATTTKKDKYLLVSSSRGAVEELAEELGAQCGMTPRQIRRGRSWVDLWLRQGVAETTIRRVVAAVLSRPTRPRVTGLGYFAGAIAEALEDGAPGPRLVRAHASDETPEPRLAHAHARAADAEPAEDAIRAARKRHSAAIQAWQAWRTGPIPRLEDFLPKPATEGVAA